jgi:peptide/nickel transport system substrate-binding protein
MRLRRAARTLGVLLCVVLVGCAAPGPVRPTDDAAQGRPAQAAGSQRLIIASEMEPPALHYMVARGLTRRLPGAAQLERLVSAGLTTEDDAGELRPQIADSVPSLANGGWSVQPDGQMETRWTIRPNARWHDGTAVTSADLLFTMQVVRDPEFPSLRDLAFDKITALEAPDAQTIAVRWARPYAFADTLFTVARALPMPAHLLQADYAADRAAFLQLPFWTETFVGTGPFKVKEFARGSHMVLTANEGYVLGRPKLDEIVVRFMPDVNGMVASVLAGAVELTLGASINLERSAELRELWRDGHSVMTSANVIQARPQLLDPSPPILTDVRFRRALMHAIDRQQMAESLQLGLVPAAHSLLPPIAPEYNEVEPSVVRYEYDPRQAVRLIEELGYAKGSDGLYRDAANQRLSVETRVTGANPLSQKTMLTVADYWQQLGIVVDQVVIPPQRTNDREYMATFPGFYIAGQASDVTDLPSLRSVEAPLPSTGYVGRNFARYMNPDLDILIERLFETVPHRERMDVLGQIVNHVSDQLPLLALLYGGGAALVADRLKGVTGGAQGWNAHEWTLTS